jgi:hypothetical protein
MFALESLIMTDPKSTRTSETDVGETQMKPSSGTAAGSSVPKENAALEVSESATPQKLTEAEQMALYEKDLQENDWGHQPC